MNKKPTYDELFAKVEALENTVKVYQSLAENTSDLLYRTDLDGTIIYVSHSAFELSGYTVDEAIGLNIAEDVYYDSYERDVFLDLLQKNGRVVNFTARMKRKDGSTWWVLADAHFFRDDDGNIIGVEGIVKDITELKMSQDALADSERLLKDIIEFLPDPTFVIDNSHRVIAWNRAIEQTSGIPKEDIIGRGDYEYAIPFYGKPRPMLIDLVLDRNPELEKKYVSIQEEQKHHLKSESFHPELGVKGKHFTATASRIYNAEGNVNGAIESIRDTTKLRDTDQEKENLISELRASISKIKTLSGLLPICAACKKIRDSEGYWNQIESYVEQHSDAEFSHGLCEDCASNLYGETDWYNKNKSES